MKDISILVVEDETITAMDIQTTLQKSGYRIPTIASSAEEAIDSVKKYKPHLVLMDIVLKGKMDGIEAANIISKNYHIPIIFLTAYNDDDTFGKAKLSMPYAYLTKPFQLRDLQMAIELSLLKHQMDNQLAKERDRIRNEFLATISHELRTPLNGIIGLTELMYFDKIDFSPKPYKEYLGDILSCSYHLLRLINHVLDLTKVEAGKMEIHPVLINLHQMITEVRNTLLALAEKNSNPIHVRIDPQLTDVIIDPDRLREILYNYLSNAIKFSLPKQSIEVDAYSIGNNQFQINVKDHGIGIAKEDLHDVFIAFKQINPKTKKGTQGTGLGLALTRRITEMLGGSVGVKSVLGQGSTFYVILPCKPRKNLKNKKTTTASLSF
ncbi:MAG: hypothetical protein A3F42_06285 [Gammaproteobacteria bacterium RIFCSPHIGHO2_12_FULL_37_34]|nr:MAG: hypothetical protein A3F42_06285 [Gammaproteobacteria bacterium RIFCSPHIGHO2_12_FULL_37_34]